MLEQKRLFKLTIVFGWINQNNGIINQILLTKEFYSLNQKFSCPYNNHILWLTNQNLVDSTNHFSECAARALELVAIEREKK